MLRSWWLLVVVTGCPVIRSALVCWVVPLLCWWLSRLSIMAGPSAGGWQSGCVVADPLPGVIVGKLPGGGARWPGGLVPGVVILWPAVALLVRVARGSVPWGWRTSRVALLVALAVVTGLPGHPVGAGLLDGASSLLVAVTVVDHGWAVGWWLAIGVRGC